MRIMVPTEFSEQTLMFAHDAAVWELEGIGRPLGYVFSLTEEERRNHEEGLQQLEDFLAELEEWMTKRGMSFTPRGRPIIGGAGMTSEQFLRQTLDLAHDEVVRIFVKLTKPSSYGSLETEQEQADEDEYIQKLQDYLDKLEELMREKGMAFTSYNDKPDERDIPF